MLKLSRSLRKKSNESKAVRYDRDYYYLICLIYSISIDYLIVTY